MPDWSYQTVFRRALFRLRPETARRVALGAFGRLGRMPGGLWLIRLMGHARPDPRLARAFTGLSLAGPVGLGHCLDPELVATESLAELGSGFIEIGPVVSSANARQPPGRISLDAAGESVEFAAPRTALALPDALARLTALRHLPLNLFARIEPQSVREGRQLTEQLADGVTAFVVQQAHLEHMPSDAPHPVFVAIAADAWHDAPSRDALQHGVQSGSVAGIVVEAPTAEDGAHVAGRDSLSAALATVRELRASLGNAATIIVGCGIHSPADAVGAVEAGADLVQVDSGLVFSGPGLPKRINEALLHHKLHSSRAVEQGDAQHPQAADPAAPARLAQQAWFWALLLGLSLLGGGLAVLAIAATRVLLPYDETLTGLDRQQLDAINPRLLSFMKHDRVTLAGTMLAVGLQYAALAYYGIRRGMHWASVTVSASALTGFFMFFAFLGFEYFDPLHAFVSAILLQITFMAMAGRMPPPEPPATPDLVNDEAWHSHQWGQLLFLIHGAVLMFAGAVITAIGMTDVFVQTDLEFLETSAEQLVAAHPQLKPLVAHDRAAFGGMLISCGIATLLPALWGFRRGEAWLWFTLMIAGNVAYLTTLWVHMNVGYSSHLHLLPVYGGLAWLWAAGMFSYPYMVGAATPGKK